MKKGIQLYSVRDQYSDEKSLRRVLEQLSKFGYDGVEFYRYSQFDPKVLCKMLQENGLVGMNAHVPYVDLRENAEKEIEFALQVGLPMITVPFIPEELRQTEQDYEKIYDFLPILREKCTKAGITLSYHNHWFEFEKQGASYILDRILGTDKELFLEPDTFWMFYAKVNPEEYLKQYENRIYSFHVKDYTDLHAEPKPLFCAIGQGKMQNAPIVQAAKEYGAQWIVVEQDNSQIDTLESARFSIEGMKNL